MLFIILYFYYFIKNILDINILDTSNLLIKDLKI